MSRKEEGSRVIDRTGRIEEYSLLASQDVLSLDVCAIDFKISTI